MKTSDYNSLNLDLLGKYIRIFPDKSLSEIVDTYFKMCGDRCNSAESYREATQYLFKHIRNEVPRYDRRTAFHKLQNIGFDKANELYARWTETHPSNGCSQTADSNGHPILEYLRNEMWNMLIDADFKDYPIADASQEEKEALSKGDECAEILREGFSLFVQEKYGTLLD